MNYDIIGDIHGRADRLQELLRELGYTHRSGAWRYPSRSRKAIFVGDFIDRGPGQLPTLKLVDAMMQAGTARAVMGNHEFNAIGWHTPDPAEAGTFLRTRRGEKGAKNRDQHKAFLNAVGQDSSEHRDWVNWFLELPLWIEEPEFQVIHACWSPKHMDVLRPHLRSNNRLKREVVEGGSQKGKPYYDSIETLLKGVEVTLPSGYEFKDEEGHVRNEMRTRWWNPNLKTYSAACIAPPGVVMPEGEIDAEKLVPEPDRPTFIGHYWLGRNEPLARRARHVACVDYSVAREGGRMVAYRFDGEKELLSDKFVAV